MLMKPYFNPPTDPDLLAHLAQVPMDQAAWKDFVELYRPVIANWCRCMQLQAADAEDVTQQVLAKLVQRMPSFQYDPAQSFRGWLHMVVRHACSRYRARQRRFPGAAAPEALDTIEARRSRFERLANEFDAELLERAMQHVKARIRAHTWEAFRLLALEGWTAAQAATKLGMKPATVLVAKSRVQKAVREEVTRLESQSPTQV